MAVVNVAGLYAIVEYKERQTLEKQYALYGDKATYDLWQEAQKLNIKANTEQTREFVKNGGTQQAGAGQTDAASPDITLSQDEIASLKKDAYLEGDADAKILVVEYSDIECPFCIRQHNESKAIQAVKDALKSDVVTTFKNNRGVNHDGTEAKAVAVLCAGKLGGTEAYAKYYKALFETTTGAFPRYALSASTTESLVGLATSQGLKTSDFESCLKNKDTLARFTAETAEASRYGLGGTPGTMIINTVTGKATKIEGAYPAEKFITEAQRMLGA